MPYIGHALTLPLEDEYEEHFTDAEIMLLTVDSDDHRPEKSSESQLLREDEEEEKPKKSRKSPKSIDVVKPAPEAEWTHFDRLKFVYMMIRSHFFIFLAITSTFYVVFHYGFDTNHKELILRALSFCDDWKQMAFFLGIYISFAVKKVSDIISHVPPTDKIANLVSVAVKKHGNQKAIMKYVCTALAMVFSYLSPMVRKRLFSSEKKIRAKLENQTKKLVDKIERKLLKVNSGHFMPIKWSLHVVHEARIRNEVDERLYNTLVVELNQLHTHCDRLINFKHETFSWGLTKGVTTSVYVYFVVGAVRQLWSGITENHSNFILTASLTVHFLVFLMFLIVLRSAEQIVKPFNEDHDVFELNRILNEKLEVAAFVLNKECDLRMRIKDQNLLP